MRVLSLASAAPAIRDTNAQAMADGEIRALGRRVRRAFRVPQRILIIVFVANVYSLEKNSLLDLWSGVDYRQK
jgi:hypothetical protein